MLTRLYPDRKLVLSVIILVLMASLSSSIIAQSDDALTETPPPDIIFTDTSTAVPSQTLIVLLSPTLTETVSPTNSATPSLVPTESATLTAIPSITDTPVSLVTAEFTETFPAPTETITFESTLPNAITETVIPSVTTATAQPEITEIAEVTLTLTAEGTAEPEMTETPEVTAVTLPTETATETSMPTIQFIGTARYQSRLPDNAGIEIVILDGTGSLLSTTTTAPDGSYTVLAPSSEFFWLLVGAPLYRQFKLGIWPGETLPEVTLAGGDLDGDGCVGPTDLALLTAHFAVDVSAISDISGDGHTDASDLAILAGNYDSNSCLPLLEDTATATPTPIVTDPNLMTPTDAATIEVTGTAFVTPESTVDGGGDSN